MRKLEGQPKKSRRKIYFKGTRGELKEASYFKKPPPKFSANEGEGKRSLPKVMLAIMVLAVIATMFMRTMTAGHCHRSVVVGMRMSSTAAADEKLLRNCTTPEAQQGESSESSQKPLQHHSAQEEAKRGKSTKGNGKRKAVSPPRVPVLSAKARYANGRTIRGPSWIQNLILKLRRRGGRGSKRYNHYNNNNYSDYINNSKATREGREKCYDKYNHEYNNQDYNQCKDNGQSRRGVEIGNSIYYHSISSMQTIGSMQKTKGGIGEGEG